MGIRGLGPEFDAFVHDASPQLLRLGVRLTGDVHLAEDLLQSALWRVARRWQSARDNPVAYARRTLINLTTDHWRARAVRVKEVQGIVLDFASESEEHASDDDLLAAIWKLAPRQRAVVVLRYWEGLSVEESAATLGCSPGTIKSTASKALAQLRHHLEPTEARS